MVAMASQESDRLHVAIVGAGIGGLALAMALHKKGISYTVYEEASQFSVVGAGIGFGPNGLRAMQLIEPEFLEKYEAICVGNKPADAQWVFFEGLLMEPGVGRDKPWYGNSSWGHRDYTRKSAHRKALLDIMTSFIPIETVQFSKRLTSIKQERDKVVLAFEDGEIAQASILVGSDGIQSVVRKHVLQDLYPDEVEPVYADSYCYRGVIRIKEAEEILGDLTDVAKMYLGHNRSCVTYRISGEEEFNFLLNVADQNWSWTNSHAVTEKVSHEEMMSDFENQNIDPRFLELLGKAKPIRWGMFHHAKTSTYCNGRVVLVGDSAHASLPYQAAGASQGLEDAVVLANLLPDEGALKAYDAVRRPRAQKQLEQAMEVGEMIFFRHPETEDDMQKILPRLQKGRFEWLWFHDIREDIERGLRIMKEEN